VEKEADVQAAERSNGTSGLLLLSLGTRKVAR
jgi:hypothetical protein